MSYLPVCAKNAPLRAINSEIISLVKNLRLVDSMKSSAWSNNNTQSNKSCKVVYCDMNPARALHQRTMLFEAYSCSCSAILLNRLKLQVLYTIGIIGKLQCISSVSVGITFKGNEKYLKLRFSLTQWFCKRSAGSAVWLFSSCNDLSSKTYTTTTHQSSFLWSVILKCTLLTSFCTLHCKSEAKRCETMICSFSEPNTSHR